MDQAAGEPLPKLVRLRADLSLSSLFRHAPVIEALEVDAPQLRLARTAPGHYDIDDLIARFAPKADAASSGPALFALYNLEVRDASLRFDDRLVERVHTLDALQLGLSFRSNRPAPVDMKVAPRLATEAARPCAAVRQLRSVPKNARACSSSSTKTPRSRTSRATPPAS